MTIIAKIIEHSRSAYHSHRGIGTVPDLITFQLRYPRFIHAELMTHRLFSRNASSSRAIPIWKMIENIKTDTAMPIHWGKHQPGMQADEEHEALVRGVCGKLDMVENTVDGVSREAAWLYARDRAIEVAEAFHAAGYHKQVVNRILEPYMHIDVIVTASGFDNFFWLRRHKDAQPEIKALADAMWEALKESTPRTLSPGGWHLPYVTDEERYGLDFIYAGDGNVLEQPWFTDQDLIKMSVARSARVSYLTHDGNSPDFEKDIALYDRLVGSEPLHASPAEHQATPDSPIFMDRTVGWENGHLSGNFSEGWIQYRKTLPGERCVSYDGEEA